MYVIKKYTYEKAKKIHVHVKPSKKKNKKIDVFDLKGNYLCSIGAIGYKDYPTYLEEYGIDFALKKKKLYKSRHENDRHVLHSPGWFADQLLW